MVHVQDFQIYDGLGLPLKCNADFLSNLGSMEGQPLRVMYVGKFGRIAT